MSEQNDNKPYTPPTAPLMADSGEKKPNRTQGLKIIMFTGLILVIVFVLVFMTLSNPRQEGTVTEDKGRGTMSDSGKLRADLIAAAAKWDELPPPSEPVVSQDTAPAPGQIIIVQQPRRPRKRVRALSEQERSALQQYNDMKRNSLTSKSEISGFDSISSESGKEGNENGNGNGNGGNSGYEDLIQQYMAMQAQQEGQAGGAAGNPNVPFPIQNTRLDFLTKEGGDRTPQDYSANTRKPQIAPMELKAGTVIPGLMLVGVNTDLPGTIIGQVSENVYDTSTGRYLLIPQGTRIMGTYDARVAFGQSRVAIVWNRLIYPDGSSLNIQGSPGADLAGYSGMKGRVNNHYGHLLTAALITSVFVAGAEIVAPSDENSYGDESKSPKDVLAESVGLTITDMGAKMASRALDIPPTITIKPGTRFNVLVTQDVVFTYPWNPQKTKVAGF